MVLRLRSHNGRHHICTSNSQAALAAFSDGWKLTCQHLLR